MGAKGGCRESFIGFRIFPLISLCHPERRCRRFCDTGVEGPAVGSPERNEASGTTLCRPYGTQSPHKRSPRPEGRDYHLSRLRRFRVR